MFDNKILKPALAALTVGLVVGCAQPPSRLNTSAAAPADVQASVRPSNQMNAGPQAKSSNQDERVAKAFSSNRANRPASNVEEATIIAGDFILTATVRALPEPNRFFTKVEIEEVDGNGNARVIGMPQLVSAFGQVGQISVAGRASGMVETNDAVNVQVMIPNDEGNCDVRVSVRRNGQVMADSVVEVDRPR